MISYHSQLDYGITSIGRRHYLSKIRSFLSQFGLTVEKSNCRRSQFLFDSLYLLLGHETFTLQPVFLIINLTNGSDDWVDKLHEFCKWEDSVFRSYSKG